MTAPDRKTDLQQLTHILSQFRIKNLPSQDDYFVISFLKTLSSAAMVVHD